MCIVNPNEQFLTTVASLEDAVRKVLQGVSASTRWCNTHLLIHPTDRIMSGFNDSLICCIGSGRTIRHNGSSRPGSVTLIVAAVAALLAICKLEIRHGVREACVLPSSEIVIR